jgi:hypothetical protein
LRAPATRLIWPPSRNNGDTPWLSFWLNIEEVRDQGPGIGIFWLTHFWTLVLVYEEAGMTIKSFRDLRVWQAGMDLVVSSEQLSHTLEQTASLGKQLYTLRNALTKGIKSRK